MKKYAVKSPLDYDRKRYEIDESIELFDEQAAPLLTTKPPVIELDTSAAAISPEERIAAIRVVIGQLDKGNPKNFLSNGTTPDAKVLSAMLGWTVSAADRDLAMQAE